MVDYCLHTASGSVIDIYNQERSRSFAECMETETVWEWIKRIGLEK